MPRLWQNKAPTLNPKMVILLASILIQACGQNVQSQQVGPRKGLEQSQAPQSQSSAYQDPNAGMQQNTDTSELLPPTADIKPIRPVPGAAVAYDFIGTLARDSKNSAAARMILQSAPLNLAKKVKIKANMINLRSSATKIPIDQDVAVGAGGAVDFTIKNLAADSVYRLDNVSIQDISNTSVQTGPVSVRDPYFIATTDLSNLSKARRRLALEALSEAYDWDNRNYDSRKQYASGWGWCDQFYMWAASHEFKVSPRYGSTYFFKDYNALGDAKRIPTMGLTENLAGDLIRYEGTSEGTHTFMIVAYDKDTKQLWSVEGNYNSRVMRNRRNINSPWIHGHLTEEQVR